MTPSLPQDELGDIVVGQFDDFATAQAARGDLRAAGVPESDTEIFQLNAPGQHDQYPIGGDEHTDEGARDGASGAGAGAALGGAVGLALGAAAIPIVGPLAAAAGIAAGAYVGSMRGAVGSMGEHGQQQAEQVPDRPAGVRLAVHLAQPAQREAVVAVLRRHGAKSIELGAGEWDGGWVGFNPVSTPRWLVAPAPL
jgi:hypothetical protein